MLFIFFSRDKCDDKQELLVIGMLRYPSYEKIAPGDYFQNQQAKETIVVLFLVQLLKKLFFSSGRRLWILLRHGKVHQIDLILLDAGFCGIAPYDWLCLITNKSKLNVYFCWPFLSINTVLNYLASKSAWQNIIYYIVLVQLGSCFPSLLRCGLIGARIIFIIISILVLNHIFN